MTGLGRAGQIDLETCGGASVGHDKMIDLHCQVNPEAAVRELRRRLDRCVPGSSPSSSSQLEVSTAGWGSPPFEKPPSERSAHVV